MIKEEIPEFEFNIKEFGKPIFKTKGKKNKIKTEIKNFFNLKM